MRITTTLFLFLLWTGLFAQNISDYPIAINQKDVGIADTICQTRVSIAYFADGLPESENNYRVELRVEDTNAPHNTVVSETYFGQDFANIPVLPIGEYRIYLFLWQNINGVYQYLGYNNMCGHLVVQDCPEPTQIIDTVACIPDTVIQIVTVRDTIYQETVCSENAPINCPLGISTYPTVVEVWFNITYRWDNPFNEEIILLVYNENTGERVGEHFVTGNEMTTNVMQYGVGNFVVMIHGDYVNCGLYDRFQVLKL